MTSSTSHATPAERRPDNPHGFVLHKIRQISSGIVIERSGPDARELVATGGFEYAPDADSVYERLSRCSHQELVAMLAAHPGAVSATPQMPTDKLAFALLPLAERGVLTFPEGR